MTTPLRVLILEDNRDDAELVLHLLHEAGFDPNWQRVETEVDYLAALRVDLDIILADYRLPQFNGLHAFQLMRERGLDIPFIVVTGSLGDELAVECIKQGVTDYLLKDRLSCLGEAVRRAIEQKQIQKTERDQRALAEALTNMASVLNSTLDLESVLDHVLDNLESVVPYNIAFISLIENRLAYVVRSRGSVEPSLLEWLTTQAFSLSAISELNDMVESSQPLVVPDVSYFIEKYGFPEVAKNLRGYIGIPIRLKGKSIGILNLTSDSPSVFNPNHTNRLQAFADHAAVAIENARLYDTVLRHAGELEQRVKERTAEFNLARERAEAILNSSSDIIILTRPDKTIDQVNPVFNLTFAYTTDEIIGQPLTQLTTLDDAATLEKALNGVLEDGQPRRIEIAARRKDSTLFDADLMLSPIVQPGNHTTGIVCGLRDISQHKQLETRLRQTLEREMQVGELRARFVSMASHEFRNPLASILLSTDLMTRYGAKMAEERKTKELDQIRSRVKSMVELLDDVLVVGTAEAGKLKFDPKPLHLKEFCENILLELQHSIGADHRFAFFSEGHCSGAIMDQKLLRHILGNLLSNAIKYSPVGSTITFDSICEDHQVVFRVKDEGIGIPEKDQARLFETFHRAENVGNIPGTGLGLAIVKQSVDLHGGRIELQSAEGQGSTFTVYLPLNSSQNPRGEVIPS